MSFLIWWNAFQMKKQKHIQMCVQRWRQRDYFLIPQFRTYTYAHTKHLKITASFLAYSDSWIIFLPFLAFSFFFVILAASCCCCCFYLVELHLASKRMEHEKRGDAHMRAFIKSKNKNSSNRRAAHIAQSADNDAVFTATTWLKLTNGEMVTSMDREKKSDKRWTPEWQFISFFFFHLKTFVHNVLGFTSIIHHLFHLNVAVRVCLCKSTRASTKYVWNKCPRDDSRLNTQKRK